ncbi:MAG: hypothetical protein PHV82_00260 [Victivallaceae bacterium]|nr:hypothetical protein [Victivallaceae bacterium]
MDTGTIDIVQNYEWNDVTDKGTYCFANGYLNMRGDIACKRELGRAICGAESALEITFRVILGKSCFINWEDSNGAIAFRCMIDADGQIKFTDGEGKNIIDTGLYLTFHRGIPFNNPRFRKSYTVISDEHVLNFRQFDLRTGEFMVVFDNQVPVKITIPPRKNADFLKSVEVQAGPSAEQADFRLKSYREYFKTELIAEDIFQLNWEALPETVWGTPYDNITGSEFRPKFGRWLEVTTGYGYVKTRIPPLRKGYVEFDLMTEDIEKESVFLIEEASEEIKNGVACCGIYHGKFCFFNEVPPVFSEIRYAEDLEPLPGKVYLLRLEWDCDLRFCSVSINGIPVRFGGRIRQNILKLPKNGVDTLTIHPGLYGARLSELESRGNVKETAAPLHKSYWGAFRIKNKEW